ncbi:TBC1 domain family member 12-like isoform X1 [Nymphalis io]|uniref:TBC1 domain family member 12-like isoform X1 n=1 Tax=Inachis io TaxID=171585 RepID=UPI0021694B9F|nr:TBC1 domain family member 12-like isoform X1 [Nymphalis io]XP_050351968.1 TBC1 domain family member 12-like isoform X1 [Nymphalis io]
MSTPCQKGGMRLSEALDNIQLAYNPITKQLHFVSPKVEKQVEDTSDDIDKLSKKSSFSDEGNFSISTCEKSDTSDSPKSTLQWGGSVNGHQRGKDGGSFSSTVSSLSECSLGSSASKEDDLAEVNTVQEQTKLKKKGLSGFFSRGVFPWKSNSSSKTQESNATSTWRLFGSKSNGNIAKSLTTEVQNSLTPASSAANTPHHHKRQGSSASEKQFDDLVASSIALIQHDRPSNLPAKCTEEALRHKAEHARMVEAARRRVEREAAARHARLQESIRMEERLARHAREWTQTILPDWHNMKNAKRTLDLWWSGLPPAIRGRVWQLAIENKLKITHEMYEDYVAKAKQKLHEAQLRRKRLKVHSKNSCDCKKDEPNKDEQNIEDRLSSGEFSKSEERSSKITEKLSKMDDRIEDITEKPRLGLPRNFSEQNLKTINVDPGPKKCCSKSNPNLLDYSDECSMELIQLDIARTFPHLCIFQPGGPYFDVLHELLAAYVCYRPDIGYIQGMSFIAAVLILNMEAPQAFVCFANLLDGPVLRAAFTRDGDTMQRLWKAYARLLRRHLPALAEAVAPELYLLEWLYTAFAKAMPLDAACRVWDVFLRDGDSFLFNAALGILHLYQDELKDMDFISAAQFLTKLPEDLDPEALFKSISSVSMTLDGMSFEELVSCCPVENSLDDDVTLRL